MTCTLPSGCAAATSTTAREPAQRCGESVASSHEDRRSGCTGRVERHIVGALEVRGYTTLAGQTFEQWLDTALGMPR